MPKEALLTSTTHCGEIGLRLDSLALKSSESEGIIASVPTSFGGAVVATRVPAVDAATWAAGLSHLANDHRYYEATHESLGEQFDHLYLLLKDHTGRTRAIQPFLVVKQDLVTGLPQPVKRAMDRVRRRFPSALMLRMLMVGCSAGEGHLVRDETTGSIEWTAQALSEALQPVARALKTAMIVMKEFPTNYRKALRPMKRAGYVRVPSMPGSRLDLNFKTFDEYMQTRLSHKTRKNLRSKFRKAAASGATEMQVVRDVEPHIDELFPLYRQVVERSAYKFEELTKTYFVQMSRRLGDRALFFIWRQQGKAVAFSSCAGHDGVLRDHYIGLDYTVALDHHLYFVTFRDIITWALENQYHTYYSAALNYEPKYHLRHDLVPLDLYVRTSWDLVNPILRAIVPYLEPTRYDPIIRKFANAHELW
jgi:hypothetical protein